MSDSSATQTSPEATPLKRALSPKLLLLFIVGDILGTGVYSLTGKIAGEVGGAAWAPFLIAFAIATLTAMSYLELVTKYPQAAGAALYTHKAFGIHFVTFIVAFAVMSSGITSASTASSAFASYLGEGILGGDSEFSSTTTLIVALIFMTLVMLINLRGVAESVKTNFVLTCIELTGLIIVILAGLWAVTSGNPAVDFGRVVIFDSASDKGTLVAVMTATSLAFFAMVGFEDSVNMAEETQNPEKTFPKIMLTGLGITGTIYLLVSILAVALVPVGTLEKAESTGLQLVVTEGFGDVGFSTIFPFIAMLAVANSALINMMMASRLIYGMARQDVLPRSLGKVNPTRQTPVVAILFTTLISFCLISYVSLQPDSDVVGNLGDTTAFLLLSVFTVVNIALLVLRRDKVNKSHFKTPTFLPPLAIISSLAIINPWFVDRDPMVYRIAGALMIIGVALWVVTWLVNRGGRAKKTGFRDPEHLGG